MGSDEAFPRDRYLDLSTWKEADDRAAHVTRMHSHHVAVAMRHLGQQLAIAAGLVRAYRLGVSSVSCGNCDADYFDYHWSPGNRLEAP